MFRSEKRSLIRFLIIYLGSTFLLFSIASWLYYISSKHHLLDQQREPIKYEAEHIKSQLRTLHRSNAEKIIYPSHTHIQSAIYDLDKAYIFGTFQTKQTLDINKYDNRLYHIMKVEPYYLGAAYLLLAKDIDFEPIEKLQRNIFLFMLGAGLFFAMLGYFLGKLFVAPMRDSMEKMNRFIQDTTHELNTPISTILTNIEMIETFGKEEANATELKRIEIASKTLSRIYDDLTYLNLNHQYHREINTINMSRLVEERVVYFSAMAEAKLLKTVMYILPDVTLKMDKNDAFRLIDNLLSNAIKYNKKEGTLGVRLTKEFFEVSDTGVGIQKENMHRILQRFQRANNSEGGFGIGLDIVNQVVNSYDFVLHINSKEGKGTEVNIQWKK
ncbi:MAG TPA: HAMP domain-containing histidine kinase [Sulfurovum sp.]|nr:HAMP domain-containing histidine kinase [Sulfurovum sp.]